MAALAQWVNWAPHSMLVSLWDVTKSQYIEISRSDGPDKGATAVDLARLKSYQIIQTMYVQRNPNSF